MRFTLLAVVLMSAAAAAPAQPPSVTKILNLFRDLRAADGHDSPHVRFAVTESELNEYLTYSQRATPRPGIRSVTVKVFPYNYISTFTVVDFDAIERWKPGTVPLLLRPVLTGQKAIWLDVRFKVQNRAATFSVEKAYFGGIRLPAFFVEKMIEIVAARQPEKYDTSKPVPLPFHLRQLATKDHTLTGEN